MKKIIYLHYDNESKVNGSFCLGFYTLVLKIMYLDYSIKFNVLGRHLFADYWFENDKFVFYASQ